MFFQKQHFVLHESPSMLRYMYIACFVISGYGLIYIRKFLYRLQSSYTASHSEIKQFQEAVFIVSQILLRCCYRSLDVAFDTALRLSGSDTSFKLSSYGSTAIGAHVWAHTHTHTHTHIYMYM